jgi:hypothetical protein
MIDQPTNTTSKSPDSRINWLDLLVGSPVEKTPPADYALYSSAQEGAMPGLGLGLYTGMRNFEAASALESFSRAESVPFWKPLGMGVLKSTGASVINTGLDTLLQKEFGQNIGGHDLFRPTAIESLGIGFAAAASIDMRARLVLAAGSWVAGRVANYFHS